jgi:redox-sensitive bicupin YhaK (pirin superfamily)
MIRLRQANERGKTKLAWLDSHHTFSFGEYHDPKHMGFYSLRVINDDTVAPGKGFSTHAHQNMEILSWVIDGSLAHRDSTGVSSVILPSELQRMSAGTGVRHSEFNGSQNDPVHFLQIWLLPAENGITPSYEQKNFPVTERQRRLRLMASPDGREGSVRVHQDALVYDGLLSNRQNVSYELSANRHAWIHVVKGEIDVNGAVLQAGDAAAVSDETSVNLTGIGAGGEIMLFDLQ